MLSQLEYTPKGSPQGLFPYLTTSLCLTKTSNSSYQNTNVQQSKFIIWLTCPIRTSQLTLSQTSPFPLLKPLLQKHLSLSYSEAVPRPQPYPSRVINLLCSENLVSGCVLCLLWGPLTVIALKKNEFRIKDL